MIRFPGKVTTTNVDINILYLLYVNIYNELLNTDFVIKKKCDHKCKCYLFINNIAQRMIIDCI